MADDFLPKLHGEALAKLKSLESDYKRELRKKQTPIVRMLKNATQRRQFLNRPTMLTDIVRPVILSFGRRAYGLGAHVGAARLKHHRFDDDDRTESTIVSVDTEEWYESQVDQWLRNYASDVRKKLVDLVKQNQENGGSISDLTDEIGDLGEGLLTWQAERIARTESMRLWNVGHYETLEQSDEVTGYEYSVVMDDRVSHICAAIDGLKVQKADLTYLPPLHPHCRTICQPVFSFDDNTEWGSPDTPKPVAGFGSHP